MFVILKTTVGSLWELLPIARAVACGMHVWSVLSNDFRLTHVSVMTIFRDVMIIIGSEEFFNVSRL